ncbi:MAG: glycoside hydrolase, partial [Planctomycetota bacterium]
GSDDGGDNITEANLDLYAHYQAEVLQHFDQNLGINFQSFSPMNEPSAPWWQAGGGQEGQHVSDGRSQRLLIQATGEAIAARGLDIGIAAAEEFNASLSVNALNQYDGATLQYVTQINTHVYGGNSSSNLQALRQAADNGGLRLYQSEYGNNASTGLNGGIGIANRITQDINILGADGWAFWQVIEPESLSFSGWGPIWADYSQTGGDQGVTVRKQFHVYRQFSANIRPGSFILSTSDSDTVAAYDPATEATTLVVTNDGLSATTKTFNLADGAPAFTRVIQTSENNDYVSLGPAQVSGSTLTAPLPGNSVTTYLVYNRPNLIQNATLGFAGEADGAAALAGGWQATGDAGFSATVDNSGDGGGSAALFADSQGAAGVIRQTGTGDGSVDLTGVAYQLSVDLLFQQAGSAEYDATTAIGLEFYGADGQTLAHADVLDFTTELDPIVEDSAWRLFRTPVVMAPAGTRYVAPVVRLIDTETGSNAWVHADNAYLQTVNYTPRGRQWTASGSGSFADDANWQLDASDDYNSFAYLGPVNTQFTTIIATGTTALKGLTFDSANTYRLVGSGALRLEANPGEPGWIDVRQGNHQVSVAVELAADTTLQAMQSTSLLVFGQVDAAGFTLRKQGAGAVTLSGGLDLAGGALEVFAAEQASLTLGANSDLSGTLNVLFDPGFAAELGQVFELIAYSGAVAEFTSVLLPQLAEGLDWELAYQSSALVAEIVSAGLAGDYNGDGLVDGADYARWRGQLGMEGAGLAADGNNDQVVNALDLELWQQNFGRMQTPGPAALQQVPEPACLAGVALALAAAACGRRRP